MVPPVCPDLGPLPCSHLCFCSLFYSCMYLTSYTLGVAFLTPLVASFVLAFPLLTLSNYLQSYFFHWPLSDWYSHWGIWLDHCLVMSNIPFEWAVQLVPWNRESQMCWKIDLHSSHETEQGLSGLRRQVLQSDIQMPFSVCSMVGKILEYHVKKST
jgi:hypothetical protein